MAVKCCTILKLNSLVSSGACAIAFWIYMQAYRITPMICLYCGTTFFCSLVVLIFRRGCFFRGIPDSQRIQRPVSIHSGQGQGPAENGIDEAAQPPFQDVEDDEAGQVTRSNSKLDILEPRPNRNEGVSGNMPSSHIDINSGASTSTESGNLNFGRAVSGQRSGPQKITVFADIHNPPTDSESSSTVNREVSDAESSYKSGDTKQVDSGDVSRKSSEAEKDPGDESKSSEAKRVDPDDESIKSSEAEREVPDDESTKSSEAKREDADDESRKSSEADKERPDASKKTSEENKEVSADELTE